MFKRLVEWMKGEVIESERYIAMVTVCGYIRKAGRWPSEPYRCKVWTIEYTKSRESMWVKPERAVYYLVDPITCHTVPDGRHGRSIHLVKKLDGYVIRDVQSPEEAEQRFIRELIRVREQYDIERLSETM